MRLLSEGSKWRVSVNFNGKQFMLEKIPFVCVSD